MAPPRVYISHSSLDVPFTERLVAGLKSAGALVWVDYEQIAAGDFARNVDEGIGSCDWVVVVVSANGLKSPWVSREVSVALNLVAQKRIVGVIPISAEDISNAFVPPMLDTLYRLDGHRDFDQAFKHLVKIIGLDPDSVASSISPSPTEPSASPTLASPAKAAPPVVPRKVVDKSVVAESRTANTREYGASPLAFSFDEDDAATAKPVSDIKKNAVSAVVPGEQFDSVYFTVTSPSTVMPGSVFILNLWAHFESQRQVVIDRAREAAAGAITAATKGPTVISRGVALRVKLKIDGCSIDPNDDALIWVGEIANATFPVRVSAQPLNGSMAGCALIYANGLQIARIDFLLQIGDQSSATGTVPTEEKRYRTAFVSYSSKDRSAVAARVQGIQRGVPGLEIFWDCYSLKPGDRWQKIIREEIPKREVFYLFWSRAAKESRWVEAEWRIALEKPGLDRIVPVPLVSPEEVPPPPELSSIHFGDWIQAWTSNQSYAQPKSWWRFW